MTLESAITFFIAIFIFGITPGPGTFAILARSMLHGAKSCLWLSVGMVISDIAYLVMACFGLAAIATTWEEAFVFIRIAGAIYLIYLGYKMWTSPITTELTNNNGQTKATGYNSSAASGFVQGFLISASNPKVILFYIAFLPTFMDLTLFTLQDVVVASAITFIALMAGLMMIAIGASQVRRYLHSEKSARRLNRTAGSIMIGAGAYLGTRS